MSHSNQFDNYLSDDGPAALVIRQYLMPVEGSDAVVFPPTYAKGDNFPGGYNIDGDENGTNYCLIDSIGSQANRIEPIFKTEKYQHLVPQVIINTGGQEINILDAGHRAGDAIIRCTDLQAEIQQGFKAILSGNADPLAKVAPTSLVFGVWDSRDTQAKLPRLIASTIRAFNVRRIKRSAQYVPATDYVGKNLLSEPTDKATKDTYSERGFIHVPATGTPGGVIATGGIRRDATLSLAALKLISTPDNPERAQKMRRYILGIALTAFTLPPTGYLRQGCLLVLDPSSGEKNEFSEVYPNGVRKPCSISHAVALEYASEVAKDYEVKAEIKTSFDKQKAQADVQGETKKAKSPTAKAPKQS